MSTAAARLQDRFGVLLEAAPDAMVIIGADGRIMLANAQAERLFGFTRDELIGQPVEILIPERFRGAHPGDRTGYFRDPRWRPMGAGLDLYGRRKDGSDFPVEVSLSPIETEDGRLAIAAVRDVSEQRALREQLHRNNQELVEQYRRLQEASRLKSEFLANMSHELRTPLNAVIGFAELIHDGKVGPIFPDQKEYLGDILTSSRHLLRLINDALDLTRFESGRVEFRPEPLDLARTVGEVTDGLDGLAARKRIRVEAEIDPSLDGIVSDPASLKQILYNYLSNALKFTPDEGRVVVRVRPEPPDLFRIEVEDTGIGIRTEDLGRLFVEFQQLDAGAAKKYQGTGLGLALTKRIVEAQGGHVGVRSVPGSGSTFFAVLPRSPRPARGAQTVSASQQPAAPPRGRVLLADDDDALREVYATILSEAGHEVETARDGRAAMDLIWKNAYDVVLSDISMPGMTGVQVLRAVRQRDLDVPVVLMTGNPMLETAIQAIEHGALGYLLKPVIRDTLLRTVDEALRLNRLARLKREALSYLGAEDKLLGDRASLEATFTRALTTVWMAYQPIVRASDSAVAGHEALMRAAEPALASPTALLDAAERLRRIPELGRIVRDLVAAAMNDGGPAGPVFINLHPLELMDEALFVTSVGLSRRADDVILEVTERASVAGMVDLQERVKALRGLGYRIALDDLGAGYAGLSSFAVLRPDFVKIDMALVRGVDRDPMKRRLITSMTAVCRDSGITVVAEGIETEAEREVVVSAGCDLLQGYLFGRPVRAQTHLTA